MPSKAVKADTRATNRRLVLQYLFHGEPMSRADLARATDLTPATVSALVADLDADGLVMEVGTRRDISRVGKPPTMLQIRPDARDVIALDLSDPQMFRAAVVNLSGDIRARVELPVTGTGASVVDRVVEVADAAIAEADNPVLGIGVGTPGVVGADGVVVEASYFDWHGMDLGRALREATGHPAHIGNDANVAAIAEFSRGGHDCTNLAVVKIGSGVGAGFILGGRPFEGEHAGAGEIGHLVVDRDGPGCRCGNHGCLETFTSVPNIEAAMADAVSPEDARRAAAARLGIALAAIVAILDIDHIMVAGPERVLGPEFCRIATQSLRSRCLDNVAESVRVEMTALGEDVVLLGAAGLVMSQELGVA